jgi:GntR family transcriptional regulator
MTWDDQDLEDGPVPLWFQIAERLRREIEKGSFDVGTALPAESALIRRFGISRTTARSALDQLEHEGLIARRSGKGSIVLPPRVDQPLNLLASFSEDMRARGLTPSYRTLDIGTERATAEVATNLGLTKGRRVLYVDRLLIADDVPIAFSKSWLSPNVLAEYPRPTIEELDAGSLYVWLERVCGVRIAMGDEYIEAEIASEELSEALNVEPCAPVLVTRRRSLDASGQVAEYVVLHYRSDRYRFHVEMVRP